MTIFRNMTIKYKLMTIVIVACTAGLMLAGASFLGWERNSIRNNMVRVLATRAAMISENSKASLTFQDNKDAEKVLQALHVDSSMISAFIFNDKDELFAEYYRDSSKIKVTPAEFKKTTVAFTNDSIIVSAPIVLDNEIIGTICLQSDLESVNTSMKHGIETIIGYIYFIAGCVSCVVPSSRGYIQTDFKSGAAGKNCFRQEGLFSPCSKTE